MARGFRRRRVRAATLVAAALALAGCGGDDAAAPLLANQLWDVWVASADLSATSNGSAWDRGGSPPDAYVVYDGRIETPIRSDTSHPAWGRDTAVARTTAELRSTGLRVQLMDSDFLVDEPMTEPRVFVVSDDQIRAGGFTVDGWDGTRSVTFAIAPHE